MNKKKLITTPLRPAWNDGGPFFGETMFVSKRRGFKVGVIDNFPSAGFLSNKLCYPIHR